jgi:hypothetical protein
VTSLAVNAYGTAIAAWHGPTEGIDTALGQVTTNEWQQSVVSATGAAVNPGTAIDPRGDALLAWDLESPAPVPYRSSAALAFRPAASGTWTTPLSLFEAPGVIVPVSIAFDARGDGLAVWGGSQVTGAVEGVEASFMPAASGAWQPPVTLSASGRFTVPRVAFDSQGNAVAVWSRDTGAGFTVEVDTLRAAEQTWQGPVALTNTGDVGDPAVAVGPHEQALVVWSTRHQPGHASFSLDAAVGSLAQGKWRKPVRIVGLSSTKEAERLEPGEPHVAVDGSGNAIVLWEAVQCRSIRL